MSPVMKIPGSEAGSGVGLGSKSGSVSQRYGSTDPDQDRTKISRIRNNDFYVPVPKTVQYVQCAYLTQACLWGSKISNADVDYHIIMVALDNF
jgi:hypothetical protein